MRFVHFDEAKQAAIETLRECSKRMCYREDSRTLLVVDLFGKLRIVLWSVDETPTELQETLASRCGPWWTGEFIHIGTAPLPTSNLYEEAWQSARRIEDDACFRVHDRHRSRTAWFADVDPARRTSKRHASVIVFYSFKGGLGRSTLLTSFAIQRARAGERVCVLDFDLDAPGVGHLLSADATGMTARWGIVDFLLERSLPNVPLEEYYHRCDRVAGEGQIFVFPSGDARGAYEEYLDKLARVDLEEPPQSHNAGICQLLDRISEELAPQWILLDARTGLSESAGQLLSGIADLHVLLGTTQEQCWQGLNLALDRLGKHRLLAGDPQLDVLLIHAMAPLGESGKQAREAFNARAEQEFEERYYAQEDDDVLENERFWTLGDKASHDAPHTPLVVDYDPRIAYFTDIADIADALCEKPYQTIIEHIRDRFLEK